MMRILLWDIDGTLIRTRRPGIFRDFTRPALARVFGTAGRLDEVDAPGMTDLQIVSEALRDEGYTHERVRERAAELWGCFYEEMERVTRGVETYYALPGAREALEAVAAAPRYRSALLTGNVERAAYLKLRLVGLEGFFRLPGAFGEDSHDRRDLPALAAGRIGRHLGLELRPEQFVVIGDTPNDIACAKHFGARSVAVATGRSHTAEDLLPHEPDALLPDLADTAAFLRVIDSL